MHIISYFYGSVFFSVNKTANLIRKEILSLLGDLPKIYDGLASDCKGLGPYIKMYEEFIDKVHNLNSQDGGASSKILPDLSDSILCKLGNFRLLVHLQAADNSSSDSHWFVFLFSWQS